MTTTVRVRLGARSYPVLIGRGLLRSAGRRLRRILGVREVFVCTAAPVARRYGSILAASCRRAGLGVRWLRVPDGERAKALDTAVRVLGRLTRLGAGRDSVMVALGGGTVGDLAGFVAGIYMRGIRIVQIPTTLEAQVDAAIGGKTAVDLREGKNLAGLFHQPAVVLSDPEVLRTLPRRQLRAGMAEVVKHGVIASAGFFDWLERSASRLAAGDIPALERAVAVSSRIKAAVVSGDERESGRRMILNFGHTFGHGLEAAGLENAGAYRRLMHGEAVSVGMVCAARLSRALGVCAAGVPERVENLLWRLGLPVRVPRGISRTRIARAMAYDKKKRRGRLRVVLTRKIGDVTVRDGVSAAAILRAAN